jgi:hypothetical protein
LFTTGYKRLTEGGQDTFGFGFVRGKAFWMWEAFGRENCWRELLKGKNEWLKGGLLKGKELLKENC